MIDYQQIKQSTDPEVILSEPKLKEALEQAKENQEFVKFVENLVKQYHEKIISPLLNHLVEEKNVKTVSDS
jgi:hypothetical protein